MTDIKYQKKPEETDNRDKIVHTNCSSHCGGNCEMMVHVRDNKIIRIEPVETDGRPSMCLRGHAYRQRVYSPDRLLYPLKRTGSRGSGEFARISWDEALDTVAGEMQRIKAAYGNESILHFCSMCDPYVLHHVATFHSLLCRFGGYTAPWGLISGEGHSFSEGVTYGRARRQGYTGHPTKEYLDARLIIMWGWNPVTTQMGTDMSLALARAKENGTRIISVDPRHSDSAATFADKWIPIRPGTDSAVLLAMTYVVIKEDLQDETFIENYTVGFDRLKDYLFGEEDGIAKTPEWADAISGVPAADITELAREYAGNKPAVIGNSYGPGRSAFGEQYQRAAEALQAITGNLNLEILRRPPTRRILQSITPPFPMQPNQVENEKPPRWNAIPSRGPSVNSSARINVNSFTDAILKGREGGYPADIKLLWLSNTNYMNQLGDINRCAEAFNKLEFVLVTEQFMSTSAKFADIVLPVCTFFERFDIIPPAASPTGNTRSNQAWILNKAIEPLGESRSQLQICQSLAPKLGITDFGDKSDEVLAKQIAAEISEKMELKPDSASKNDAPAPEPKLFRTPSEKIEIYSSLIEKMNHPQLPAIPKYIETWESLNDPLAEKYPLQLITPHFKRRAHSQFDNLPWLRELQDQTLTINSRDAGPRGIKEGDMVRIVNKRGEVRIPARVTERIMPGVVAIPQGAWFAPDENGVDHGGSANVLTSSVTSPAGAFASHTALVQVEKI